MNPVYVTRSFDAINAEMAKRGYLEEEVRAELAKLPLEHPIPESPNDYRLTAYPASDPKETPLAKALMRYMARGTSEEEDHYHSIMLECQKTKTFQMIKEIFHILGLSPFTRDVASEGDANSSEKASKKAFFLVSQNMQDLTAQNCERIVAELGDQVQLFVFTSQKGPSTSKVSYNPTLEDAQAYLRVFANPPIEGQVGPKIPFFIFLANTQQITKMNAILCTIRSMGLGSEEMDDQDLSSFIFFDEADQTYPIAREILMDHTFDTKIYRDFGVIRPPSGNGTVRRIYWISATQEEMVLAYPECGVSKQAQIEFQDGVVENHYSILDSSAIVHYNTHAKGTDHNQYLIDTIEGNREHFFAPHPNGSYRKVIGLSSVDNESQLSVVRYINELGGNVILLNQEGVFLYTRQVVTTQTSWQISDLQKVAGSRQTAEEVETPTSAPTEELSAATVMDEAPATVEEELAMEEDGDQMIEVEEKSISTSVSASPSPVKKADLPPELQDVRSRGIKLKDRAIKSRNALIAKAYHVLYPELKDAPLFILGNRKVDRGLTFHYAPISSDAYSFILTDLIMGRIPSWRRAVQAIGRGNGVIKHRADFVGDIHYWVDTITFKSVVLHCKMMSDPMIIAEKAPESPDYDAQELIEILTAKYRDPDEDADDGQKKKRGPRAKYQFDLTTPCDSYQELCKVMQSIYPDEKFRKSFTQLKSGGLFVSTRLKKHFGVTKAEELSPDHICTEEMIHGPDPIDWKKILYSSDMRYLMVPYYQLPNLESPKWIGVMKNRVVGSSEPSSASGSEASDASGASDLTELDALEPLDLEPLGVDSM